MSKKLAGPATPGEVWIHIDRFNKRGLLRWAVQWCNPATGRVEYHGNLTSFVHTGVTEGGNGETQPRAYVRGAGSKVTVQNGIAIIAPIAQRKG